MTAASSPAYANEPPVIRGLPDRVEVREGEAVAIPFTAAGPNPTVFEPDNDVVEYAIQHIDLDGSERTVLSQRDVRGEYVLPGTPVLEINPQTAARRLVWWPDVDQAGTHTFRFTATDEYGASTQREVTVTVTDRSAHPAIVNVGKEWGRVLPGETLVLETQETFAAVPFRILDQQEDVVSVTAVIDGQPAERFYPKDGGWRLEYKPDNDFSKIGLHEATLTATDAAGNESTFSFRIDVRRDAAIRGLTLNMIPEVLDGLVRAETTQWGETTATAIVRGHVTFGVAITGAWGSQPVPFPPGMRYRYVLHTPDAQGHDITLPLSGVLTGPNEVTWDSASIADGTYAVSLEIISPDPANTVETALERFFRAPLVLVVDNDPGVATSPWLPVFGFTGPRMRWTEARTAVDWVRFTGQRDFPAAEPWIYDVIEPPANDTEREALLQNDLGNGGRWFVETWSQVHNGRYDSEPFIYRTREGHPTFGGWHWQESALNHKGIWRFPETDGPRNQGAFGISTQFRPDPSGSGFIGISPSGRLFRLDPDGTVTTLAGTFTRRDILPLNPYDWELTQADYEVNQWQHAGQFVDGVMFNLPRDLVFDPADPAKAYIADTDNHRIAVVDLSGPIARVTTFAGVAGQAGDRDGDRTQAILNVPVSVEIVGRTLYIADQANNKLRAIDLETGMVSTVSLNRNLSFPSWIRRFRNGDLAVMETDRVGNPTGALGRVRFSNSTVEFIANGLAKPFDVDWRGMVGPFDHILGTGDYLQGSDHGLTRVRPDGTLSLVTVDAGPPTYYSWDLGITGAGNMNAYPLTVVIDDKSPRFGYIGQYQPGLVVHRPMQPGDPMNIDGVFAAHGRDIYYLGTIPTFYPHDSRPSLAALHGRKGHGWLGSATFDELAKLTDAELATYIRSGMAGHVARPELTGPDLQAPIYYIRVYSIQGKQEHIDPGQIATNLRAAGYWNDLSDTRQPEIRNAEAAVIGQGTARITWQTDEPTIGPVQYGPTDYYGLASPIESGYSKDHAVTLENLTHDKRYDLRILSKDQAGNLTHHQASFDVGTPPAVLCGDLNKDGKVDIADAVLLAQVIVGSKPPPQPPCIADFNNDGQSNVVDLVLLIKFILGQVAKLSCCGG